MTELDGVLLGLVQGLTEFLPVSSSGHLALAHHALGFDEPKLSTEVMLHAGTLLAILVAFRVDLWNVVCGVVRGAGRAVRGDLAGAWRDDDHFRLGVLVALGTVPVAIAGLAIKDSVEALGARPAIVGLILVANGIALVASRWLRGGEQTLRSIALRTALFVGVLQIAALLPGISRSGTTILAGLAAGLGRDAAGRFSFLLAIPAVFGATVLEVVDLVTSDAPADPMPAVLIGTAVAAVSGYGAILVLMRLVRGGRLWVFGPYCIVLGAIAAITIWA